MNREWRIAQTLHRSLRRSNSRFTSHGSQLTSHDSRFTSHNTALNLPDRIKSIVKGLKTRLFAFARRRPKTAVALALLFLLWLFCLPRPLFQQPVSVVLEDRDGQLLGARIATDGQWRFPESDSIPAKYAACVIAFEDKRFRWHPGVDPLSLFRSMGLNIRRGKVVSGGSTITMQVIRMARENPSRNVWEKIVEVFMATRLELTYSKRSILNLYASHAPFGGNVVGIEAASWRYYGKSPHFLTWAEAATMAVLPNSPALIHPGRNRNALMLKRTRLGSRTLAGEVGRTRVEPAI